MSQSRTKRRGSLPGWTRIDFSQDTLGELRGVAIGIGMPRDATQMMSRDQLEAAIQAHHAAECRDEMSAAAIGGPVTAVAVRLFLVVAGVAL